MSTVVSDSSPLNYLALLSDFDLLRLIYRTVVIPPAVYHEVVESGADYPVSKAVKAALGNWIFVAEAPSPEQVATLRSAFHLDLEESEAILVAEALGNTPVLMDERRGVQCARSRGVVVIRTPRIYANGFRLADRHYDQILRDLGEL